MADKLVTVAQYSNYIEAEMAKQLLADYGIQAVVTGDNVSNVYSGIPALTDIELQVLESQAEQAQEILESQLQGQDEYYNEQEYEDEEDEDEEQW